jgi:excisionase family DNA binding protein
MIITPQKLLSSKEAATYLGVSTGHLLNLVSQGKIKYQKLGRLNRYHREDLDAALTIGPCCAPIHLGKSSSHSVKR